MSNPIFLICMVLMLVIILVGTIVRPLRSIADYHIKNGAADNNSNTMTMILEVAGPIILGFVPFICYFWCCCSRKCKRKNQLLEYVDQWNRNNLGLRLSLGGEVIRVIREQAETLEGSEQGGGWDNFDTAIWPAKGLAATGYLYIFVNLSQRQEWCRENGKTFVMPVPHNQQNAPAGYILVPQSLFEVPAGYALVPQDQVNLNIATASQHEDLPPSYEESKH